MVRIGDGEWYWRVRSAKGQYNHMRHTVRSRVGEERDWDHSYSREGLSAETIMSAKSVEWNEKAWSRISISQCVYQK